MSVTKKIGETIVQRIQIIGTQVLVFNAYEPSAITLVAVEDAAKGAGGVGHSTISSFDGEWYGDIASRRLTPELAAMRSMSEERSNAVDAYHRANYEAAYALILQAFPEAAAGTRRGGEITLTDHSLSPWPSRN